MRILLIVIAIVASLLIAGCGESSVNGDGPLLQLGGNLPLTSIEKELTFTVKNYDLRPTQRMSVKAVQTTATTLDITISDANTGRQLRSTGLSPVEYVANSCEISYDGTNWSKPTTDLLDGIDITNLKTLQTFTVKFLRK